MLSYLEQITRKYNNGVVIDYSKEEEKKYIYVHKIESVLQQKGYGTKSFQDFLKDYEDYDIYVYTSYEWGVDIRILDDWYAKLGFKRVHENSLDMPLYLVRTGVVLDEEDTQELPCEYRYRITHVKQKK